MENILNPDYSTKDKAIFEAETEILLSDIKFNKIRILAVNAVRIFRKDDINEKRVDTVYNFCMRNKRGSKRYREILNGKNNDLISTNILKLGELLDQVINLESSMRLNSLWTLNYLNNETRTFLFKFHQHLLGLNTRVAHFVRNHPRTCTFCSLSQDPEDSPETFLHLFFECNHVERLLDTFFTWIFNTGTAYHISSRSFFQGFEFECHNKNKVLDLVLILVKKYI